MEYVVNIRRFCGWMAGSENCQGQATFIENYARLKLVVQQGYIDGPLGACRKTGPVPIEFGGPPGNRTPNLRIKSPLLCLVELEAHIPRRISEGKRLVKIDL